MCVMMKPLSKLWTVLVWVPAPSLEEEGSGSN